MTNKEKATLFKNRHLSIIIEWGGVENMFTNCSDISEEGIVEFLEIMDLDNEKEVNNKFGDEVEKKVIELNKQGLTVAQISKEFNGHPAIPKIKRILAKQAKE